MTPADIARIIFALSSVVLMLSAGAYLMQRLGLAHGRPAARKRRLKLVETLQLDPKRRAALIRCDGEEHLVILNANSATVVARNASRASRRARSNDLPTEDAAPRFALSMNAAGNPFARPRSDATPAPDTDQDADKSAATLASKALAQPSSFADSFANADPAPVPSPDAAPAPRAKNTALAVKPDILNVNPQAALLKAREAFLSAYRKVA